MRVDCHSQPYRSLVALEEKLLLLLDALDDFDVDLQGVGHSVRRGQSKPLGQRDIGHAVTLVELEPNQLLSVGSVFNIVS